MVGGPKLNLVLMDQMENGKHNCCSSIGAIPMKLMGRLGKMGLFKPHSWDVGEVQGCFHQRGAQKVTAKEWKATLLNERLTS